MKTKIKMKSNRNINLSLLRCFGAFNFGRGKIDISTLKGAKKELVGVPPPHKFHDVVCHSEFNGLLWQV